jgi:hypothetical protein
VKSRERRLATTGAQLLAESVEPPRCCAGSVRPPPRAWAEHNSHGVTVVADHSRRQVVSRGNRRAAGLAASQKAARSLASDPLGAPELREIVGESASSRECIGKSARVHHRNRKHSVKPRLVTIKRSNSIVLARNTSAHLSAPIPMPARTTTQQLKQEHYFVKALTPHSACPSAAGLAHSRQSQRTRSVCDSDALRLRCVSFTQEVSDSRRLSAAMNSSAPERAYECRQQPTN